MRHFVITVTNNAVSDRRMNRTAALLRQNGWKVTLVGRVFEARQPQAGYHFIRCQSRKGPRAYLEYNWRLARWLRSAKIDVLCTVDVDTMPAGLLARLGHHTKVIVDSHEYFEEVPELEGKSFKQWIWKSIARRGFRRADQRWTVSEELAMALRTRYEQDFHVVPNYPQSADLTNSVRQRTLVYLGVLNEGRGLEMLIRSMHQIDAQLWLLGEGDLSKQLRTLVHAEGLQGKVEFKGWVDSSAIAPILQRATIGINLLSSSSESYHLSLANKFFDYVQAGTPQICMSFPAYQRMIKEFEVGISVDQLDQEEFVRKCQQLLADQLLWKKMHVQCLEARKHWKFSQIEAQILDLVESL